MKKLEHHIKAIGIEFRYANTVICDQGYLTKPLRLGLHQARPGRMKARLRASEIYSYMTIKTTVQKKLMFKSETPFPLLPVCSLPR